MVSVDVKQHNTSSSGCVQMICLLECLFFELHLFWWSAGGEGGEGGRGKPSHTKSTCAFKVLQRILVMPIYIYIYRERERAYLRSVVHRPVPNKPYGFCGR